ncbi:MAG: hypothetical protein U5L09_18105 [Bacteroidales bacterium]|nr:hypothetical protein [Bacteroidales bacterium]
MQTVSLSRFTKIHYVNRKNRIWRGWHYARYLCCLGLYRIYRLYTELIREQVPNNFIIKYLETNRKSLENNYQTVGSYKQDFKINEALIDDFLAYAKESGVEFDEKGYNNAEENIHALLKALIARNIFRHQCLL